ncbi:MAG: hypothetical protein V2I46_09135 [Bacteroides sp.]|jgi:hypothetical protein|nr:hypothetical protein [Bacteroides sp.]
MHWLAVLLSPGASRPGAIFSWPALRAILPGWKEIFFSKIKNLCLHGGLFIIQKKTFLRFSPS